VTLPPAQAANIERFFTAVKSVNELDKLEIRNVIAGILMPNDRDACFTLNYHRAAINIDQLLRLTDTKQFQTIAMLTRSIFEIAIEVRLISVIPDSVKKIHLYTELEKLRSAKKITAFKTAHPDAKVASPEIYEDFIRNNEQRLIQERDQLWPGASTRVEHWSRLSIADRAKKLGKPFDRIYELQYPQLSWYVHSGITGVANLQASTFALLAGISFTIALESYVQILEALINEYKIYHADDRLKRKLDFARKLPFTDSQQEADALARAMLA
jgi:Family of unknown function (DUF5677)